MGLRFRPGFCLKDIGLRVCSVSSDCYMLDVKQLWGRVKSQTSRGSTSKTALFESPKAPYT